MQACTGFYCSPVSLGAFSREEANLCNGRKTNIYRLAVINNNPTRRSAQNDYCLVGELALLKFVHM